MDLCRAIARDVLFRVTYRISNRTDAEDAAQEVLIRVCSKIHDLKNPKAFGGWLHSIIMNETNRYLATGLAKAAILDIQDYIEAAEEEDSEFLPQEYVLEQEDREKVMEIIRRLPDRQQEAIILHYYEALSITETADVMGVSRPAASRYLALAREKIKSELEKRVGAEAAYGRTANLAVLPMGALITEALQLEAGQLTGISGAWLEQAVGSCNTYVESGMLSTAGASATSPLQVAALTLLVSMIVAVGVWALATDRLPGRLPHVSSNDV
ncbi:MAG: sigma-70 family RNA polymerase sigma factor, partial [Eggerthellaceae bacterium]|nr:sigma-70 family RNA polymerase sigma factor [Eggerthellaceae bacterium]